MTTDPLHDAIAECARGLHLGRFEINVIANRILAKLQDPVVLPVLMQHLNAKAGWHQRYDDGWAAHPRQHLNADVPCWVVVAPQEPADG